MNEGALYLTADAIGTPTGGGQVTYHERRALKEACGTAPFETWSLPSEPQPWGADELALQRVLHAQTWTPKHVHVYAGTFTKTIAALKQRGSTVSYTAAAHDIKLSEREHCRLGVPFDYPHLTDPGLWSRYVDGYLDADWLVCPSKLSASVMQSYTSRALAVKIIPHGFERPTVIKPVPKRFTVGYLGQPGPDKGLRRLFEAWAAIGADVDGQLVIAGRGTLGLVPMARAIGRGRITILGEVESPSDLYNACSVYVQPSITEGFGIEILEALAHERVVFASNGAGAAEHATYQFDGPAQLAAQLFSFHRHPSNLGQPTWLKSFEWPEIRKRYVEFFKGFL